MKAESSGIPEDDKNRIKQSYFRHLVDLESKFAKNLKEILEV